jgi:hypothetical protein
MRLHRNHKRNVQGSVLLVTLGITFVLGLGLASYLALTRWQHASVVRSQAWNAAMALAEAGVEEALAQLNPSALVGTNVNRAANGWSLGTDGMYHIPTRRKLPNGEYDVAMTADPLPTIYATGYVEIPALSATVARTVKVTTVLGGVFRGAMAARVNIDLKGNNIATDSFDSGDSRYSTDGLYDPAKRRDRGDVASTDGVINVQNANVMGTLWTGPEGSYTIGANGSVGDLGWVLGGTDGLQDGHYRNDFNMDFPAVAPPYETGLVPAGKEVDGTNYTWVLGSANYMITDSRVANLKTGEAVLVVGKAKLYVTTDFIMQGGSSITILPNASLEVYVGGAQAEITKVNNQGRCGHFTYYGLPGNTSLKLSGNDLFLGSIYAPNANFVMSGSGNNLIDFQGACAVNTIGMNGHFNFHFDENLRRKGPVRGYQVGSWEEI